MTVTDLGFERAEAVADAARQLGAVELEGALSADQADAVYAAISEYWVLDLTGRRLVVHRDPIDGRYEHIEAMTDAGTITGIRLPLTVAAADLMAPRDVSQEP